MFLFSLLFYILVYLITFNYGCSIQQELQRLATTYVMMLYKLYVISYSIVIQIPTITSIIVLVLISNYIFLYFLTGVLYIVHDSTTTVYVVCTTSTRCRTNTNS